MATSFWHANVTVRDTLLTRGRTGAVVRRTSATSNKGVFVSPMTIPSHPQPRLVNGKTTNNLGVVVSRTHRAHGTMTQVLKNARRGVTTQQMCTNVRLIDQA